MNSAPPPIPGLVSLYWRDFTIRYAVHACVMGLLLAVGIQWASQPVGSAQPPPEPSFEAAMADKVSIGGLILSALGAIVLLRRYLLVRKILSQGTTVKGVVEKVDTYERSNDNRDASGKFSYTRAYYVTIRFNALGGERRVRRKLPISPSTYQAFKDHGIDMVVLDSAPDKALIRSVYLGRF